MKNTTSLLLKIVIVMITVRTYLFFLWETTFRPNHYNDGSEATHDPKNAQQAKQVV